MSTHVSDDQMRRLAEAATYYGGNEQALADMVLTLLDRVAAAEAEVERLRAEVKATLYPLADWTVERATAMADDLGASENSLFASWALRGQEIAALRAAAMRVRALIDSPYVRWIEEGLEGGPAMVFVTAVRAALDEGGDDAVGT